MDSLYFLKYLFGFIVIFISGQLHAQSNDPVSFVKPLVVKKQLIKDENLNQQKRTIQIPVLQMEPTISEMTVEEWEEINGADAQQYLEEREAISRAQPDNLKLKDWIDDFKEFLGI